MTTFYEIIPFLGITAAPFKKANYQIGGFRRSLRFTHVLLR